MHDSLRLQHPSPFPTVPKKAICCDAVRLACPDARSCTQVWLDPLRESRGAGAPLRWVQVVVKGKSIWGKREGELSTVFQTSCFTHFFTKACLPVQCLFYLEVLVVCWILMKKLESPDTAFFLRVFFSIGKEHLFIFNLLCLVTCDNTCSFSNWVQWANLGWNLKLSWTSTAAAASIGGKSKAGSSD